jgi:hypothetical protein
MLGVIIPGWPFGRIASKSLNNVIQLLAQRPGIELPKPIAFSQILYFDYGA